MIFKFSPNMKFYSILVPTFINSYKKICDWDDQRLWGTFDPAIPLFTSLVYVSFVVELFYS